MGAEPVWPDELFVDLDRSGPVPLYFQISSRLEQAIRSGVIPAGGRLENEIAICEKLGLSRPTVRRAIQELVDKGLLVRRRGVGTQVVQTRVSRPVELTSLNEDLGRVGHQPSTRVLVAERVAAEPEIAAQLNVPEGTEVLHLRRVRYSDDVPMAVLTNYLPPRLLSVTEDELASEGLYSLLRARGVTFKVANQTIGARRATNAEAELLGLSKGSPVLTMERVAFDHSGHVVETGHHCYRPDRYAFETTLVAK